MNRFFATVARGLEEVCAAELTSFGADKVEVVSAGVAFEGPLEVAYRACIWSRVASRILCSLHRFEIEREDDLYEGARAVDWSQQMDVDDTLAVDAAVRDSIVTHSQYAALRVKDAVVDQFRERVGRRPSVDPKDPKLRINLHLRANVATIGVDLSGAALHQRGWRIEGRTAPLKENLAAGLLALAGWEARASEGQGLVDPLCGVGTFAIEAALQAADVAPGLFRDSFGFLGWSAHDDALYKRLLKEARERDRRRSGSLPRIVAYDADPRAVRAALQHVDRTALRGLVHVERRDLLDATPPPGSAGIVICNPPYGERLGEISELELLYTRMGDLFKHRFGGWTAFVLTSSSELTPFIALKSARRHTVYNGALECRLLEYPLVAAAGSDAASSTSRSLVDVALGGPAAAFANRLKKNAAHLRKWAKRQEVSCYRLYDADLPEYALEVDVYDGWVHVQEYERPKSVAPVKAVKRLNDALLAVSAVLEVPLERICVKQRKRQRGRDQYERVAESEHFIEVAEGGHRFYVNLRDYFDTGLFLDHREVRALIGRLSHGKRFLNLFAYTGSATVYAAGGGASATTTVDLSNTYLDWAEQNLRLNHLSGPQHRFVREDTFRFLARDRGRYDVIFLDPPTFSNSKAMERTLDIQRDHLELIRSCSARLAPRGVIVFSNNFRRFKFDRPGVERLGLTVEDITEKTMPEDFRRASSTIHRAWLLRAGGSPS